MSKFDLNPQRIELLNTDGHLLIIGGPGSGKTSISLIKANKEITVNKLLPRQKILFLSFARATVSRVFELAKDDISKESLKQIKIETYHGFAWNILKSHGYLINNKPIKLLPPHEAAYRLANIELVNRHAEKNNLFNNEGLLHFDLFAIKTYELLSRSIALSNIICDTYPIIILDEFQDTNSDEWLMIQELGKRSRLISLADAEQRIYDFRGSDPKRIGEFILKYSPTQFDFGSENNRSNGTDIIEFGNDLLTGQNKNKNYINVQAYIYQTVNISTKHIDLKTLIFKRVRELKKSDQDWSLGVLVPSNRLMFDVSSYLSVEQKFLNGKTMGVINHEVMIDSTGPSLSAILIGRLIEHGTLKNLIEDICSYIFGIRGDKAVSKESIKLVESLKGFLATGIIRGANRKAITDDCERIINERIKIEFIGNPESDWILVRKLLLESRSDILIKIGEDSKHLRFLNKGAILRLKLSELWLKNNNYKGISSVLKTTLTQEHFKNTGKELKGINLMTIHKSKGKEFNEVIIYEDSYSRIARMGSSIDIAKSRLLLRVGVTRARENTIILTPKKRPCELL